MSWSYLQGALNADTGNTTASTATATFGSALTAGSLIWVGAGSLTGVTITGVTDTAGNTYTRVGSTVVNTTQGYQIALFYAVNSHTTASNVVTVSYSATVTFRRCHAQEHNYPQAAGYTLDGSGTGQATTGSTYTTSSMTPTAANDLAVQFASESAANDVAPGTGWTAREPTTNTLSSQTSDQALSTVTPLTGAAKSNGAVSGPWTIIAALFSPAPVTGAVLVVPSRAAINASSW